MRRLGCALLLVAGALFGQAIPVSPIVGGFEPGQKGMPRVAAFGGVFAVAWTSDHSLYLTRFDSHGQPLTEVPLLVAGDAEGADLDIVGTGSGYLLIYPRVDWSLGMIRLSATGQVIESRKLAGVPSGLWAVSILRDGDRLLLQLATPSGVGPKVAPKILPIDQFGKAVGSIVAAPSADFAMANDGRAAVRWDSEGNLHFAILGSAGATTTIVATQPPARREYPALTKTESGYLAVWQFYNGSSVIEAMRLDADGHPTSPIFTIARANSFLTTSIHARALDGQRVLVTWETESTAAAAYGTIVDSDQASSPVRLGDGRVDVEWNDGTFGIATAGTGRAVVSVSAAAAGLTSLTTAVGVSVGSVGHRLLDAESNGTEVAVLWTTELGNQPIALGGSIVDSDGRVLRPLDFPTSRANIDTATLATNGRDFLAIWCEISGHVYARILRDGAPTIVIDEHSSISVDAAWAGDRWLVSWVTYDGTLHLLSMTDTAGELHPGTVQNLEPRREGLKFPAYRTAPRMALGRERTLLVWQQQVCTDAACDNEIRASAMSRDGIVLDPDGVQLAETGNEPEVTFDGSEFIVGWTGSFKMFARVSENPISAVAGSTGRLPAVFAGEVESVAISFTGEAAFSWADYSAANRVVRLSLVRDNKIVKTQTTSFVDEIYPFQTALVSIGTRILLFGTISQPTPRVFMNLYVDPAPPKRRAS